MRSGSAHDEIQTLLGAYALDAVEPEEAAVVERHLAACPRCRAEVDAHREVAGALGNTVVAPPAELWDRIAGRLSPSARVDRPPEMPRLSAPPGALAGPAAVHDLGGARRRRGRGPRAARAVLAVVAAAAVVAVVVLGVNLSRVDSQLNGLQRSVGPQASRAAVNAALAGPHRVARLISPAGDRLAEFVIAPDGRGYLVSSSMAPLPGDETYQLWGEIAGRAISLGLLGSHPGPATFTVAGSVTPTQLLVTVEPSGGVATPDRAPVAAGHVVSA
jgi:anti-sigma factor RsiW